MLCCGISLRNYVTGNKLTTTAVTKSMYFALIVLSASGRKIWSVFGFDNGKAHAHLQFLNIQVFFSAIELSLITGDFVPVASCPMP